MNYIAETVVDQNLLEDFALIALIVMIIIFLVFNSLVALAAYAVSRRLVRERVIIFSSTKLSIKKQKIALFLFYWFIAAAGWISAAVFI